MADTTIQVLGYSITEKIYESSRTLVYRGQRKSDQQPVIIKLMQNRYPRVNELVQFCNQYTIAKNLDFPGIIQPYSLESYYNRYALVMEDCGGVSLKEYTASHPLSLKEFFSIAIQVVSTLEGLYRHRVIHKDIKPANILINPHTQEVKLIDFSIASLLPRETQVLTSPNVLEGTLAYMSPEQSGRMNRGIDYRTDFYSLGVTFYELLTGQLPFTTTDPVELVHCHIAKQPFAVNSLNPAIPQGVSDLISKLMAKMAEDRYQSALGLKYDLETCRYQWETSRTINHFALGQRDISDRFLIPEKLYGRETEVATLLNAFERVSTGTTEMMLVAGYSGIGKTAVVNEVHKPIVRQRGYFIRGKFDQFQRNIPFSALVQAFRDLMAQLLTENSQQVEQWKAEILSAVGDNGQVIIDVIPEVELLIGKQPPVAELDPGSSENRFNLVFQQFIRVFSSAEHPLVMFLDDLQWADLASLKFIQLLMSESDTRYLLLIGAYRDNEVSPAHSLMLTLAEIEKTGTTINTIPLAPLSQTDLNNLVADTLSCPAQIASPLTQLIFQKTQGNPFFTTQFLKALYEDGLIGFDSQSGYWQCDIMQVRTLSLTNNVVEFMALQLQKLPKNTQKVLKLAACIGNQFELSTLAIVHEKSPTETATDLWKALQEGLILPKSEIYKFFQGNGGATPIQNTLNLTENSVESPSAEVMQTSLSVPYTFLHDRVQQAAYFLIPEDQKQSTHLKIGQLLLNNTPIEEREEKIFDIVNQLNIGVGLIGDPTQRNELVQLNLLAGRKAKSATAYAAASKYFTVALELLAANSWQHHYSRTLTLYIESAEAEYLNLNFVRSAMLAEVALQNAANLLDQVKVYELKMQICIAQLEMLKAVDVGLQVLEKLGISLVTLAGEESLVVKLPNLTDLDKIPVMTDPYKLSAMQILKILCAPVFMAKPEIFPQLIITMVNLCLEHGNSTLSAFAYGFYGLLLSGIGQLDAGYHAGKIALKLLDQFDAKEIKAKVYNLFNSNIRTWKEHAKNSVAPLREGVQSGLESGDIEWGGYCAANLCSYLFFTGEKLDAIVQQQALYSDLCIKIKQEIPIHFSQVWRQLSLNFQGQATEQLLLKGEGFDEVQMVPRLIEAKSGTVLFILYVAKTILLYHFKDYAQALKNIALANEQSGAAIGFMQVTILNFYHSLTLLALYERVNTSEQKRYLEQVEINQKEMKRWADHAPMNNQHKFALIEAEKARVLGQPWQAADLYDHAIKGAKESGYIREAALANELATQFYLAHGREKVAQSYLTEAYYGYAHWGATAKADDLEQCYPQLLTSIFQEQNTSSNSNQTVVISGGTVSSIPSIVQTLVSSSTTITDVLDLAAVIKASQALSGEIQLDKLLTTLIQVVMENAGAEKCALISHKGNTLVIEAIAEVGAVNNGNQSAVLQSLPIEESLELPISVVNYVKHTQKTLVMNEATSETTFTADSYILQQQPKSILCTPILNRGKLMGILYLENNQCTGAFTAERVEVLNLLCSQAAISLENARLYQQSQEYAQQLESSLEDLKRTQLQMIQSEKMSALGNLVAGVAHEINNPVGFISGNLNLAEEYVQELFNLIGMYQQHYGDPVEEIKEEIETIELEYLREDLPKLISSMKKGTERICQISTSLRTFSRADTVRKTLFDIHEGINSTLLILAHRLKANEQRPAIQVIKDYGNLPQVACFPGQLNQVFMNILANAIDALEEAHQGRSLNNIDAKSNQISIKTTLTDDCQWVVIQIEDNGMGMSEQVKQQVFDHLFTTKPVGKGTGLGLSIAYQIVVEKHGGSLKVNSVLGQGAEFVIAIPATAE